MKLEQLYTEAAGVPEGLVESAAYIYSRILTRFKKLATTRDFKYNPKEEVLYTEFKIDPKFVTIGSISPSSASVRVEIKLHDLNELPKNQMSGAQLSSIISVDWSKFMVSYRGTDAKIQVSIDAPAINTDEFFVGLYEFIKNEKTTMVSTLAHELKHFYDNRVRKGGEKLLSSVLYGAYQDTLYKTNFKPIFDFLFKLYYTTNTEKLVRPAEVYSDAIAGNVSKKDFYKFLLDNDTYKRAKSLKDFTYEDLRAQIANKIGELDRMLSHEGPIELRGKDMSIIPQDEKIDILLKAVFNVLSNAKEQKLDWYLSQISQDLDFFQKLQVKYNATMLKREANKYKNFEAFFRSEIKRFNRVGNDTIRKIAKVHSLLKELKAKR